MSSPLESRDTSHVTCTVVDGIAHVRLARPEKLLLYAALLGLFLVLAAVSNSDAAVVGDHGWRQGQRGQHGGAGHGQQPEDGAK